MRIPPAYLFGVPLVLAACSGAPLRSAAAGTPEPQVPAMPVMAVPMQPVPMPVAPLPPGSLPPGSLPPGALPLGPGAELLPEPPHLTPAQVAAEAARLRTEMAREVPDQIPVSADRRRALVGMAQATATAAGLQIDRAQLVVVVDRNIRAQQLALVLARPDGAWEVVGSTHVSTGQPGRKLYYITPTGVFMHTADILDYRAEGTFNENHVRGLGLKGMRVWDFGWQWATKGWLASGERGQIRLEMHATDPANLAYRIGRPASEGCVRVPAAMNVFMDRHGVLDADYEAEAVQDIRYRALLAPDRLPTPLAGHAMIVVDSSGSTA